MKSFLEWMQLKEISSNLLGRAAELEDAVTNHESQSDDFYDRGTTGFTAPFEDVARIRPQNVAIIQVAARKGAKSQHVPGEKEIRFMPEDLRIIRFSAP